MLHLDRGGWLEALQKTGQGGATPPFQIPGCLREVFGIRRAVMQSQEGEKGDFVLR